jgi:hypothetical protein
LIWAFIKKDIRNRSEKVDFVESYRFLSQFQLILIGTFKWGFNMPTFLGSKKVGSRFPFLGGYFNSYLLISLLISYF